MSILILSSYTNDINNQATYSQELEDNSENNPGKNLLRKQRQINEDNNEPVGILNDIIEEAFMKKNTKSKEIKDNKETVNTENTEQEKSYLISCFSEVLRLYKTLVYDKYFKSKSHETPPITPDVYDDVTTNKDVATTVNPKDEVEIVSPRYHGRLCDTEDCDNITITDNDEDPNNTEDSTKGIRSKECPEGMVVNESGDCVEKLTKIILSVPWRCPSGYRFDRLGYCRPIW